MIDLNSLNPPQKEAVLHTEGPLLVLAGAGSGKTRVLTYRIAHLIENGVMPWHILAITFTNKAAREMLERVRKLAGEAAEDCWISTFHSCCARILRRDIEKLGYKRQFAIYDEDDKMSVIKGLCKEKALSEKEFPPKLIRSAISDAKNKMLSPEEVEAMIGHGIGGVCPFGINEGVDVYLDESLKRFETVFPACGSSNSAIEMTIPDMEKYAQNFIGWVDVCKNWE